MKIVLLLALLVVVGCGPSTREERTREDLRNWSKGKTLKVVERAFGGYTSIPPHWILEDEKQERKSFGYANHPQDDFIVLGDFVTVDPDTVKMVRVKKEKK